MYIAAFFKLAQDLLAFVQPQLLKGFIDYIETRNKPDDADKDPQEIGWELVCGPFTAIAAAFALLARGRVRVCSAGGKRKEKGALKLKAVM